MHRALLWHAESDCLWVSNDPAETFEAIASGQVEDVTGDQDWEVRYSMRNSLPHNQD